MRIPQLPQWVLTGTRPAVYDVESATAITMVAKLYGTMQDMIDDYNKFAEDVNTEIQNFEEGMTRDFNTFKSNVMEMFDNYVATIDRKIEEQDGVIADAVAYMKTNLSASITAIIEEMKESGELDEAIANAFERLGDRVRTLETNVNQLSNDLLSLTQRVGANEYSIEQINTALQSLTENLSNYETSNDARVSEAENNIGINGRAIENLNQDLSTYETTNNARVGAIENEITALNSIYVVVSSVSEMTDPTKIYINTTDSKWYYYNGSEFVIGGSIDMNPEDIHNLKYTNLDSSLRRMLVQATQMDLATKENADNILTSASYYYHGRISNDSEVNLLARYRMFDYNLNEIQVSNPTIQLDIGTYFDLEDNYLYSFEFYKSDLSNFTIPEIQSIKAQLKFTEKADTIDPTNIGYNMLSQSLKILINNLRTISYQLEDTDKIKINETLYYGSLENNSGIDLKIFTKTSISETYTETSFINHARYNFIENENWSFDVYFMKADETAISQAEYQTITEGIKYIDGSEHFELTDGCIEWEHLDDDVKARIYAGDYDFTTERVPGDNTTLHFRNPNGIEISGVRVYYYFPSCKVINNYSSSFFLIVDKIDVSDGSNVDSHTYNMASGSSITLEDGYYYEFNLFISSGISDAEKALIDSSVRLVSTSSLEVIEERVGILEGQVASINTQIGNISSSLDNINGEVI